MSGPGTPSFLDDAPPLREVFLKSLTVVSHSDEDDGDIPYIQKVWARSCSEGWTGWVRKEHMRYQPRCTWLKSLWEEVPKCELRDGYWRELTDGPE